MSPYRPVSSYLAFPPLPDTLAVYFCCTFPKVTLGGRYPLSCPVMLGLSSMKRVSQRLPGLLAAEILYHTLARNCNYLLLNLTFISIINVYVIIRGLINAKPKINEFF